MGRYLNPVFHIAFFTPICFGSVKSSPSSVSSSNRVVKPFRGLQKFGQIPFSPLLFNYLRYFTLDSKQVGRCPCAGAICSYPNCYTFLRSIPSKLGGVLALVLSVLILTVIPFYGRIQFKSRTFLPLSKLSF